MFSSLSSLTEAGRRAVRLGQVLLILIVAAQAQAQPWSGLISNSRATDWTHAGVTGGIPSANWAQCGSTIAAYSGTTDVINQAIAACGTNQYVQLGAGTFNLTSGGTISNGITFGTKSNVVLRGMGANQTFLVMAAGAFDSCSGGYHTGICSNGSSGAWWVSAPGVNWTAGYAQGTTVVTLSSVSGIVPNQSIIGLDQCSAGNSDPNNPVGQGCTQNAETDNGQYFDCDIAYTSGSGCAVNGPDGGNQRLNRPQNELFQVSAVNTSTNQVTLIGSLRSPNWSAAQSPGAFIAPTPNQYDGVESLSLDVSAGASNDVHGIVFYYVANSWVTGVRIIKPYYAAWQCIVCVHSTFESNYVYSNSTMNGADIFSMNSAPSTDNLIDNNISQWNQVCMGSEGSDSGSVYAYNFCINDWNGNAGLYPAIFPHAGDRWQLFEGNVINSYYGENYHGPKMMNTLFRNLITGWESCANTESSLCGGDYKGDGGGDGTTAIRMVAYSRYHNIIANVLGTPGYASSYSTTAGFSDKNIYEIGSGNGSIPADAVVGSTLFRWGNWDPVTNAARWCGSSSDTAWSTTCSSTSEVPTGIAHYPQSVPTIGDTGAGMSALPASLYLSSKPSWWGSTAWPAVGPDVTSGNVGQCTGTLNTAGQYAGVAALAGECTGTTLATAWGGHVNANPAMYCALVTMGMPPDGTNTSPLTFNANTCYASSGSTGTGVTPPPSISVIVQ